MQKISPFLWFDHQAEEAAKFYTSIFKNSKIHGDAHYGESGAEVSGQKKGTVMTVEFTIEGVHFTALNGGPIFTFTPAISFFVYCETESEVNDVWSKLSAGGKVMMELGEYPFSKRYGWTADKYGVTWQVMLSAERLGPKIIPSFLFTGKNFGKAQEAIDLYTSVFPNSGTITLHKAGAAPHYGNPEAVMFAAFTICGEPLTIMDGPGEHKFTFSEAISLMVNCDTQEEIDAYFKKLSAVKESEQCGWIKDKFGVSWQIVPRMMGELMAKGDAQKTERMMKAMLQMKKLDIAALQNAYDGK
jgi:predicted 3-demethylubiquinone-9 3-methyltransferase (glyoxalase superfamily)